jgi:hypothetical protein
VSLPASRRRRRRAAGQPGRETGPPRARRGAWFAPIFGATIIVTVAWAASLAQATPELFMAASLLFALIEGIVLAFIGAVWSPRGVQRSVAFAVLTVLLATPGRWEVAQLRTGQTPQYADLLLDLAASVAWAIFAGLAGATILRDRLLALLP